MPKQEPPNPELLQRLINQYDPSKPAERLEALKARTPAPDQVEIEISPDSQPSLAVEQPLQKVTGKIDEPEISADCERLTELEKQLTSMKAYILEKSFKNAIKQDTLTLLNKLLNDNKNTGFRDEIKQMEVICERLVSQDIDSLLKLQITRRIEKIIANLELLT